MGLVADLPGSPGPVQADSIAVGSAVGAFTLSDLPSIQHPPKHEFHLTQHSAHGFQSAINTSYVKAMCSSKRSRPVYERAVHSLYHALLLLHQ